MLAKYPNLKTIATEAFGGRMKMLGKTLFDNVDPAKVRAWGERSCKQAYGIAAKISPAQI